jgi:hypothetical protein
MVVSVPDWWLRVAVTALKAAQKTVVSRQTVTAFKLPYSLWLDWL